MVSMDFYNTAVTEGEGVIDYSRLPDTNTQSVGKISTERHKNTWQDCAQSFLSNKREKRVIPWNETSKTRTDGLPKLQWRHLAGCTARHVKHFVFFSSRFRCMNYTGNSI